MWGALTVVFPLSIPILGGVIGESLPHFCFFGDTMNFAARMETNGEPNRLQVTPAVAHRIAKSTQVKVTDSRVVKVKGKGDVTCSFVEYASFGLRRKSIAGQSPSAAFSAVFSVGAAHPASLMAQAILAETGLKLEGGGRESARVSLQQFNGLRSVSDRESGATFNGLRSVSGGNFAAPSRRGSRMGPPSHSEAGPSSRAGNSNATSDAVRFGRVNSHGAASGSQAGDTENVNPGRPKLLKAPSIGQVPGAEDAPGPSAKFVRVYSRGSEPHGGESPGPSRLSLQGNRRSEAGDSVSSVRTGGHGSNLSLGRAPGTSRPGNRANHPGSSVPRSLFGQRRNLPRSASLISLAVLNRAKETVRRRSSMGALPVAPAPSFVPPEHDSQPAGAAHQAISIGEDDTARMSCIAEDAPRPVTPPPVLPHEAAPGGMHAAAPTALDVMFSFIPVTLDIDEGGHPRVGRADFLERIYVAQSYAIFNCVVVALIGVTLWFLSAEQPAAILPLAVTHRRLRSAALPRPMHPAAVAPEPLDTFEAGELIAPIPKGDQRVFVASLLLSQILAAGLLTEWARLLGLPRNTLVLIPVRGGRGVTGGSTGDNTAIKAACPFHMYRGPTLLRYGIHACF